MQKSNRARYVCVCWLGGSRCWYLENCKKLCYTFMYTPPIHHELIALCGGGIHQTSIKLDSLRMPCHRAYNLRLCLGLAASWALFFWSPSPKAPPSVALSVGNEAPLFDCLQLIWFLFLLVLQFGYCMFAY